MRCLSFVTDALLAKEASSYGVAGPRLQVVFSNYMLASTAVALVVDILTEWTQPRRIACLEYRGMNNPAPHPHSNIEGIAPGCPHDTLSNVGAPLKRFNTMQDCTCSKSEAGAWTPGDAEKDLQIHTECSGEPGIDDVDE